MLSQSGENDQKQPDIIQSDIRISVLILCGLFSDTYNNGYEGAV